jgi:hypothetical protein
VVVLSNLDEGTPKVLKMMAEEFTNGVLVWVEVELSAEYCKQFLKDNGPFFPPMADQFSCTT